MPVNVKWWNDYFAAQAESVGLTESEAERVLLRVPIGETGARFEALLAELAEKEPSRCARIRRVLQLKMEEPEKRQA